MTLLLLPGMGADHRLFEGHLADLSASVVVPEWPSVVPGERLGAFAQRVVAGLDGTTPTVVGGASFGGMVALEVAAILRPRAVVLIGSCTSPQAIAPLIRFLGAASRVLPTSAFRPRRWTSRFLLPKFGELSDRDRDLFWSMASSVEPAFMKWSCRALLSWSPTPHSVPDFHIHGSQDKIIPLRRVQPTMVVQGGGHLLSLTHPAETGAFLSRVIDHATRDDSVAAAVRHGPSKS